MKKSNKINKRLNKTASIIGDFFKNFSESYTGRYDYNKLKQGPNSYIGLCYYVDEDMFYVYEADEYGNGDNLFETNDMNEAISYFNRF